MVYENVQSIFPVRRAGCLLIILSIICVPKIGVLLCEERSKNDAREMLQRKSRYEILGLLGFGIVKRRNIENVNLVVKLYQAFLHSTTITANA